MFICHFCSGANSALHLGAHEIEEKELPNLEPSDLNPLIVQTCDGRQTPPRAITNKKFRVIEIHAGGFVTI
ncbi:hypothetical protein QE152_g14175 [Popillia japonica]|uniref:Uncharacterized protein n=1 Tax=Popillia japonica TaxID=7064 RepID=A0AAW1LAZ2_POPJA